MRIKGVVLFTLLSMAISGWSNTVDWRSLFYVAETENDFNKILNYLPTQQNKADSIVLLAYKGVSKAATAQFAFLPTTKYSAFKEGVAMLEQSIKAEKSFETVLLRLVVQVESPSFLGYDQDIESDIQYLMKHLSEQNTKTPLYQAQVKMVLHLESNRLESLLQHMQKAAE